MNNFFLIALAISMLAVLGTLILGLIQMVQKGQKNRLNSNKLMRWRVYLQSLAIILFLLAVATYKK